MSRLMSTGCLVPCPMITSTHWLRGPAPGKGIKAGSAITDYDVGDGDFGSIGHLDGARPGRMNSRADSMPLSTARLRLSNRRRGS